MNFDSQEFHQAYFTETPLGAFCSLRGTVFRLWAPTASEIALHLYDNGVFGGELETILLPRGENGIWLYETTQNLDGVYYDYDVTVDGVRRRTADPYARACGLNGNRSMVLDLRRTDPHGWEADRAPVRPAEDIIYELHVKDFTWDPASGISPRHRGKYLGLTEDTTTLHGDGVHPTGLSYLRKLGITHVQLMPVYDFGSVDEAGDPDSFNWGYDPVNFNVPEGSYATDPLHGEVRIRELKQAIQALHQSGFRVIMDVVYNHTYRLDSALWRVVPWYYYRRRPDGTESNASGCGSEIASERSMCAQYILDSVLYWAEEYHLDGFRFDLMGILDVSLLNRIQAALDQVYGVGEKLLYGEPWTGGQTSEAAGIKLCGRDNIPLLNPRIGAFCDSTRDAVKGSAMNADARGFVNGGPFNGPWLGACLRGWPGEPFTAPSQTISYLSSHDDWTLWDKLVNTLDPEQQYERLTPAVLRANRLAAAISLCCQGHLFFLSGEEFGRTKNGIKNSYKTPLPINRIDWQRTWENRALMDYYRGLLALRRQLPALCDKTKAAADRIRFLSEPRPACAAFEVENGADAPWPRLLLLYNTGSQDETITLPEGSWELLVNGEDSFLWRNPVPAERTVSLPAASALILGLSCKRADENAAHQS